MTSCSFSTRLCERTWNPCCGRATDPAAMARLNHYLSTDLMGGPRSIKLAWVVNFQKTSTFVFMALLMLLYQNTSMSAWIYLALHGSYGLVWMIKEAAFPDPAWQRKVTMGGALATFLLVLGPYWLMGWLLISGVSQPGYPLPDGAWFSLCISLCILGCVIIW